MLTRRVNWVRTQEAGDKSPLAHGSVGCDPRIGGSSEYCNPLEPPRPGELHEAPRSRFGLGVLDRLASLADPPVPRRRWWDWVLNVDPAGRLTPERAGQLARRTPGQWVYCTAYDQSTMPDARLGWAGSAEGAQVVPEWGSPGAWRRRHRQVPSTPARNRRSRNG